MGTRSLLLGVLILGMGGCTGETWTRLGDASGDIAAGMRGESAANFPSNVRRQQQLAERRQQFIENWFTAWLSQAALLAEEKKALEREGERLQTNPVLKRADEKFSRLEGTEKTVHQKALAAVAAGGLGEDDARTYVGILDRVLDTEEQTAYLDFLTFFRRLYAWEIRRQALWKEVEIGQSFIRAEQERVDREIERRDRRALTEALQNLAQRMPRPRPFPSLLSPPLHCTTLFLGTIATTTCY